MEQQADDGQPIEIEQQEPSPQIVLSLDVFQSIRQAQAQHGLRHSDFKRYRYLPDSCGQKLRTKVNWIHLKNYLPGNIVPVNCNAHGKL